MSSLKERLRQGKKVTGTMITLFDNPDLAQIIKVCGYDFFIIDSEHGSFDFSAVAKILAVARMAGIPGLVRINEVKRESVLKYMDAGASGIMLPNTETVEQAKALVEYAKYAPLGNRGVSLTRMHTGYQKVNPAEYMSQANEETILMLQIESVAGVKNIDNLMAVEGIDAAFIGPNDLTQSMGIAGQKSHPMFVEAVEKVIKSAKRNNKFSGIHMMSTDELEIYIKRGMALNLWSTDVNLMMTLAKEGLARLSKIE